MNIFTTKKSIRDYRDTIKASGKTIGFVPTMGALHQGHLSLIEQAKAATDKVICSIFVNPSQFNDPSDLEKYPRTLEADRQMLETVNCDSLFNPGVGEIYDDNETWHLNIGEPEHLLEGKYRPGHYQGVTQIVYKLFDIVKPDLAFFGQKDYQQFMIISNMARQLELPVKLVMCPIMRQEDGLAMSSRNIHLTKADRQHALILSKTLNWVKDNFKKDRLPEIKKEAEKMIAAEPGVKPDYFELADAETLHQADEYTKSIIALIAAKVGETRLIDNVFVAES